MDRLGTKSQAGAPSGKGLTNDKRDPRARIQVNFMISDRYGSEPIRHKPCTWCLNVNYVTDAPVKYTIQYKSILLSSLSFSPWEGRTQRGRLQMCHDRKPFSIFNCYFIFNEVRLHIHIYSTILHGMIDHQVSYFSARMILMEGIGLSAGKLKVNL